MTDRRKILFPLLALVIGVAAAAVIVKSRPGVERQPSEVLPPLVRVIEVTPQELALDVRARGTVAPETESTLVAEVAGKIDWVAPNFADGAFFRRGQTLLKIDPRDYRLAVSQSEAEVASARVQVELERAESELARQEWGELGSGDASSLTLREPQLARAQASLAAAEARAEQARLALARTDVTAPYDGRVRQRRADIGQFVAPGTPVVSVYATAAAEVRLSIPQDELGYLDLELGRGELEAGPSVKLSGQLAGERQSWTGRVVRIGSELDGKTRMLPLYVRVDDPFARRASSTEQPLPMGLFVDAAIAGRTAAGVFVLPREALRGTNEVLVVTDGRLHVRTVDLLRVEPDRIVVGNGLEAGEQICVSPLEAVTDGMRVRTTADDPAPRIEPREDSL